MTSTEYYAASKKITDAMAMAIRHGTDATVDVTHRASGRWTTAGADDAVVKAREVMRLAGLKLESTVYDDELQERFDYWTE
jgi:hypothetical protein